MSRHFRLRLLSATILLVTLFTSGLIWNGYAGIEPPPGTEAIPKPKIEGKFIAMFDIVQDKAAFVIVGKCQKGDIKPYILGPVILDSFPADFFQSSNLEGAFISTDLIGVPPGCFSESEVVVGYVIHQVKKFTTLTPTLVIAEVVVLGVRPIPLP